MTCLCLFWINCPRQFSLHFLFYTATCVIHDLLQKFEYNVSCSFQEKCSSCPTLNNHDTGSKAIFLMPYIICAYVICTWAHGPSSLLLINPVRNDWVNNGCWMIVCISCAVCYFIQPAAAHVIYQFSSIIKSQHALLTDLNIKQHNVTDNGCHHVFKFQTHHSCCVLCNSAKFETAEQMTSDDHLIDNISISDAPETNCSTSFLSQSSCTNDGAICAKSILI